MKTKFIKKLVPFVILIAFLATFTSCNRGMGCPNNFSIDTAVKAVQAIPVAIIKK